MNIEYYCPDCLVKFDGALYKEHVTEKKICYKCHKQHYSYEELESHLKPHNLIKCKDNRLILNESIKNQINTESIEAIETDTQENTKRVEKLQNKVKKLEQLLRIYKNQGLDVIEKTLQSSIRDAEEEKKEDPRTLIIRSKYNPISDGHTGQSGYTNDAYLSMIVGNNEDVLLSAEFGNNEVDSLNTNIHNKKFKERLSSRQDHSNTSSGFMSSKFNQSLDYDKQDLDNISDDIVFDKNTFDENIRLNNTNINNRRVDQHHNQTLDMDFDIFARSGIEHLTIED